MDLPDLTNLIPPQRPSVHGEQLELEISPNLLISLCVDALPGCGGLAWPAGEVLATYLAHKYPSLEGQSILELGAGTGLVGLAAGKLGAKVLITDQKPLLETMKQNIALNNVSDCVTAAELNWGEPLVGPGLDPSGFSMVLAADCVYFEPAFPLLVETLHTLGSSSDAEILFCYKKRRKADKRFFILLKRYFTWEEVSDDPNQHKYRLEGISLFRLHHK
ncbi:hypothetical protein DL93DRAFT_2067017 [Clavulina sp. PMI_390]|nr:hypothetical protein DL93DRAFT_2067017 [Clavulina sp. PMI_390]